MKYARKTVKPEQFKNVKSFFDSGKYNVNEVNQRRPGAMKCHKQFFKDYDKPLVNKSKCDSKS